MCSWYKNEGRVLGYGSWIVRLRIILQNLSTTELCTICFSGEAVICLVILVKCQVKACGVPGSDSRGSECDREGVTAQEVGMKWSGREWVFSEARTLLLKKPPQCSLLQERMQPRESDTEPRFNEWRHIDCDRDPKEWSGSPALNKSLRKSTR